MTRGKPNPKHLGLPARLKKARKAAGLTRSALSLAAGLSNPVARNIEESGSVPRIDVVERLAAVLKVSPCHLAYGAQREAGTVDTAGLGLRVKEARERAGLARSALGAQSGISGQSVANIEDKGYKPGVDTAEQLAKALGVSPCWLAFGEAEAETAPAEKSQARAQIEALAATLAGTVLSLADLEPLLRLVPKEERGRLATAPRPEQHVRGPARHQPR